MFLPGRYSGSPQTLHGDRKQVKPMPFSFTARASLVVVSMDIFSFCPIQCVVI